LSEQECIARAVGQSSNVNGSAAIDVITARRVQGTAAIEVLPQQDDSISTVILPITSSTGGIQFKDPVSGDSTVAMVAGYAPLPVTRITRRERLEPVGGRPGGLTASRRLMIKV